MSEKISGNEDEPRIPVLGDTITSSKHFGRNNIAIVIDASDPESLQGAAILPQPDGQIHYGFPGTFSHTEVDAIVGHIDDYEELIRIVAQIMASNVPPENEASYAQDLEAARRYLDALRQDTPPQE